MYYVLVHDLAEKLWHFIRDNELLHPGDRVGVAVSGGADSVALLRLLLELRKELGVVLSVVHVNHKLRGADSDADAEFVEVLAREQKLQLHATVADVAKHAAEAGISIETAARELRYRFFGELLGQHAEGTNEFKQAAEPQGLKPNHFASTTGTAEAVPFPDSDADACRAVPFHSTAPNQPEAAQVRGLFCNKIATGHTLDDQAETVLMRIIRGTGIRGLRAIQPRIAVDAEEGAAEIIRPLLPVRRRELQDYLREIGQSWREDATNLDPKFTRNRVRQRLMPLLEQEFNPSIAERLSELAEIARAEEEFWENETAGWTGTGIQRVAPEPEKSQLIQLKPLGDSSQLPGSEKNANILVDLAWLLSEELAVQRRIVKAVADEGGFPLDFAHVEEILHFASTEQSASKGLVLAAGWKVLCHEDALEFVAPAPESRAAVEDYEFRMSVPGEVRIPGSRVQAIPVQPNQAATDADPEHLFDTALLAPKLTVRNWRPGDRFWPAHTKSEKKIKELLQERHVPQAERSLWPVVLSGDQVIWVRGFPGRARMRPAPGRPAVLIREQPLKGLS